jgi:hypothetical protein
VTASLPADVQAVFERFITTELTTVDGAGHPNTWPVTPYYKPGDPCIDVSTGLGFPQKAHEARSNPLVALLFSDPAGSDLGDPPMVLVQGSADVDDRNLEANRERYARESFEKLPGVSKLEPPAPLRRLIGWYYQRIYIHVRPERVYVWPHGDIASEPQLYDAHLEEVRSGHSEEPERYHARPEGGASAWHPRINELGARYPTAVLSLISPDGFPFAVRAPVRVDEAARWIRIEGTPSGVPFQPGPACLTPHAHGERFGSHQDFQLRGDLVYAEDGWALIPHKVLGDAESRLAGLARLRRLRRAAKRELAQRS